MARETTVRFPREDSEGRQVEITALFSPGTPDRGPDMNCAGGYPGDPEEIEIVGTRAIDDGCDVAEVLRDQAGIDDAVREAVSAKEESAIELAADLEEDR